MDHFDWLLLFSRWIHLLAAMVLVGGAAFARMAMLPAAKDTLPDETRNELHEAVRKRWLRVLHACIALLLLTGAINFVHLAMPPKIEPMPYHAIFGIKFFAAMAVFFIASALMGKAPGFAKMREERSKWLSAILALVVFIVLLSGILSQVRASASARPATNPPLSDTQAMETKPLQP